MESLTGEDHGLADRATADSLLQLAAQLRERHAEVSRRLDEAMAAAPLRTPGRASMHAHPSSIIGHLAAVRGRVTSLAEAIDDQLDTADEDMASLSQQLVALARDVEHAHDGFAQHLDAAESSLDRDWGSVRADAARLAETVTEVIGLLHSHHESLSQSFAAFDVNVMALVRETIHDVESIVQRSENVLRNVIGRLRLLRQEARTHTRRVFIDDALSSLEHAANGLLEALQSLHRGASEGARSVEDSSHDITAKVEQIVQIVETIRPVLEAIQALA